MVDGRWFAHFRSRRCWSPVRRPWPNPAAPADPADRGRLLQRRHRWRALYGAAPAQRYTPAAIPGARARTTGDGRERNTRRDPHLLMRALLILLALLAQPAAALEVLPTTLQLPAEGGRAELWLRNPGPGRWQGHVQVLAWDQQLDAERLQPSDQIRVSPTRLDLAPGGTQRVWLLPRDPAAAMGEQAYRIVLTPALAGLPRYSLPLFRAPRRQCCTPACRVGSRPWGRSLCCDSATAVRCTAACTTCASSRRTANRQCWWAGWPATSSPAMNDAGPCPPARTVTQVAASGHACRTAARSIWPHLTPQLQRAPAAGYNRPDSCRLRAREPVHTGRHR